MSTMLGRGVYGFTEAARLTGLKRTRIREWFRTRPRAKSHRPPVFQGDYEAVEGDSVISFLDLIDVFVAGQLREHGVSLQTLRRVYSVLAKELATPHPFSRRELLSDGKKVFMTGSDHKGQQELTEVLTKQHVFPTIILPFLKKIEYEEVSKLAERWHIANMVVIDPRICFGKPIVENYSLPTAILAAAFHANDGNGELVASWFSVNVEHVLASVAFEGKIAA